LKFIPNVLFLKQYKVIARVRVGYDALHEILLKFLVREKIIMVKVVGVIEGFHY